ncbi:MAG: glutathione S-transferase family protein [Hyphomicrobiaceae bacterium]
MAPPPYRLVIGNKNTSSWSLRPWLAMKRSAIPFEEVAIDLYMPDTKAQILAHTPSGKVPALEVLKTDGFTVWDSLAILEYLAEDYRDLWPQDRTARAVARAVSAEMHSGFQALRETCSMDFLGRRPLGEFPAAATADIARVVALWRNCRSRFGRTGPFLFGAFTAADAMYAPVVSRFTTYVPDLARFGDDGAAAAYVAMMFDLPEMRQWGAGAR